MKTNTTYTRISLIGLLLIIFSTSGFSTKWVVSVEDFQFNPSALPNVNLGDTIRWEWVNGTHTTTSTTIPAAAVPWDNPIDATHLSFEYVPNVAGTYNYHCMHHPTQMIASFVVTDNTPNLNVTPSNQNVTSTAGSTSFSVTSNWNWTASSDQTWCTVTPSGTGNGTIVANYTQNTTFVQRVANITVVVSGAPNVVVTVTQAAATRTILVTPSNQNVTAVAGSADFTITSNSNWNASSNSSWCTVTPSGTGNGTLTANYLANSGGLRVATITVTVTGLTPQQVTVTQDGTTGIGENPASKLDIYPNPTKGNLTIISNLSGGNQDDLTVMDINGKTIFENRVNAGQAVSMDLSAYPGGYYFVRLISNNGTLTRKVILEK
jgi:plastocyanin